MRSLTDERTGTISAAVAAILFGVAYPATAVALDSFTPIATAGISATVALALVGTLAAVGVLPRPRWRPLSAERVARLAVLGILGGMAFNAAMNLAVDLSGPTITGFVAVLYAVLATMFAVPLLRERAGPWSIASFGLAVAGTTLLLGMGGVTGSVAGIVAGLVAATSFGLYLVLSRRGSSGSVSTPWSSPSPCLPGGDRPCW